MFFKDSLKNYLLYFLFFLFIAIYFNIWIGPAFSSSLTASNHCVKFTWFDEKTKPLILIPTIINGRKLLFQLDTGNFHSLLYGHIAKEMKWSAPEQPEFISPIMKVGPLVLHNVPIHMRRDIVTSTIPNEPKGNIGLESLLGKIVIIHFALHKVCFYSTEKELPNPAIIKKLIPAHLNSIYHELTFPITLGNKTLSSAVYDSGSSIFSLIASESRWKNETGISNTKNASLIFRIPALARMDVIYGAPLQTYIQIGNNTFKNTLLYYNPTQALKDNEAIIGNRLFLNKTIVLDLRKKMGFGFY